MTDDDMVDGPQTTFDKSCAHCPAYMPQIVLADPNTGEGAGLFGQCMVRANGDRLCPATYLYGVPVDIYVAREDEQPRAVVFHDERDQ